MTNLKDQIIYNTIEYLDTHDLGYSNKAKMHLQDLAKEFHITLKKQSKIDTKVALKKFILNGDGYNETIPKLFNSL